MHSIVENTLTADYYNFHVWFIAILRSQLNQFVLVMEQNKVVFSNLIAVAIADGVIKKQEKETLYKLGEKYGYDKAAVDEEIKKNNFKISTTPLMSIANNISQVFDLIRIAISDGTIHDKEIPVLYELISLYGYTRDEISELIDLAKAELQTAKRLRYI